MEDTMQEIPQVRTMPPVPPMSDKKRRGRKIAIIILICLLVLDGALAIYWFYFRDVSLTREQKMSILEELDRTSTNDFSLETKDAILTNLTLQSQMQISSESTMNTDDKQKALDALATQK